MLGKLILSSDEGDGYGVYVIVNVLEIGVNEGSNVVLYGTYGGKEDTGLF